MMLTLSALAVRGVRHGFFGRRGGVSEGPFASLNVGVRNGDRPEAVERNRAIALQALGAGRSPLVTARQVHGTICLHVTEPWGMDDPPESDALVSSEPGMVIGVLSADCAPVLLADTQAGVVGAAHAGWKGALAGVIEAAVAGMERAGAERTRIVAAIGPCIGRRSYEVGTEFRTQFVSQDETSEAFFTDNARTGRRHFDLEGYCAARLARLGIPQIVTAGIDTCAEAERCFSYRRTCLEGGGAFGLQLSAIGLLP